MKGILVKDNNKWWVRYTQHSPLWPVTPNNMILPLLPEQNKIASSVTETYDIEFEIVEFNKPGSSYINSDSKYAKLVLQPEQDTELADIRNKLGPLKNLIQMIERGYIVPDDKLKELVEQSIPVCKDVIEYLSNGKFRQ